MLRPGILIAERDFPGLLLLVLTMTEPIVNHELNPCSSQHIEDGNRLEGVASHQLEADRAGIRRENRCFVGIHIVERNIPTKARHDAAHSWMFQIVVGAIGCASGEVPSALFG